MGQISPCFRESYSQKSACPTDLKKNELLWPFVARSWSICGRIAVQMNYKRPLKGVVPTQIVARLGPLFLSVSAWPPGLYRELMSLAQGNGVNAVRCDPTRHHAVNGVARLKRNMRSNGFFYSCFSCHSWANHLRLRLMRAGCPRSDGISVIRGKKHTHEKPRTSRNKKTTSNNERSTINDAPIQFSKTNRNIFRLRGEFR